MSESEQKAINALRYILPLLEKRGLPWIITGGFACYVYGVKRPITDIDIDIEVEKDDPRFESLLKETADFQVGPIEHNHDDSYDNWSYEVNYGEQIIDMCPARDIKVRNKERGTYEPFYLNGKLPNPERLVFQGITLNLLPKELVILNKEMVLRDEYDKRDVDELRRLMA